MKFSGNQVIMAFAVSAVFVFAGIRPCHAQNIKDGIQYEELQKYAQAKDVYAKVLAKEPANGAVYYHLAVIAYHNYQYDSARYFLDKGKQVNASEPLVYVGYGLLELHDKNNTQAKVDFDKAITLSNSKDGYVYQQIVDVAWTEQDEKDADYVFDCASKAMAIEPNNERFKISLGDAYRLKQQGGKGIRQYEDLESSDPKYMLAKLRIGQCYANPSVKSYDAAKDEFHQIIKADPNYPPVYPALGEIFFQTNHIDSARDCYQKFLALVGSSPAERLRYASFLFFIKDYKTALDELNKAYEGLPNNVVLLRLKAYCEYETNAYPAGLQDMQKMFANAKKENIIGLDYAYYGKLLSKNNQDSLAIENLYKGLKADSTNMELLDLISASYTKLKKYEKAAQALEVKVSKTQANLNPQDYYAIAFNYYQAGDYAKADTNYAMVIKYYPTWPIGYLFRAKCNANIDSLMKTGAAKPYYEKFLEVSAPEAAKYKSEIIVAEGYLSFYYYNKNDLEKAKEYGQKVKELDPNNDQNNKLLKYISDIEKKKKKQ